MDRSPIAARTRALLVLGASTLLIAGTMTAAFARADLREPAATVFSVLTTLDDERGQDPVLLSEDEEETEAPDADDVEEAEPEDADQDADEVEQAAPPKAPKSQSDDDDRNEDADEDRDEADEDRDDADEADEDHDEDHDRHRGGDDEHEDDD